MAYRFIDESVEFTLFDDDNYAISDVNGNLPFVLGMHDNRYNSDDSDEDDPDEDDKHGDVVVYQMYAALDGRMALVFDGNLYSEDEIASLYTAVRFRKATIAFTSPDKGSISITFRTRGGDKTLILKNVEDDTYRCLKKYYKENRLIRAEARVVALERKVAELTARLAVCTTGTAASAAATGKDEAD